MRPNEGLCVVSEGGKDWEQTRRDARRGDGGGWIVQMDDSGGGDHSYPDM